jgi:hypothetical protein
MKKPMKRFLLFMTGVAMLGFVSSCKEEGPQKSDIVKFSATLNSGSTIPRAVSTAVGTGAFEYNKTTMELSYNISYQNIVPTAVTLNSSDPAWERGPIWQELTGFTTSQVTGKYKLNFEQQYDLIIGRAYVNIPTKANIYGEIRGQILPDQVEY